MITGNAPPVLDFSAFRNEDPEVKARFIKDIGNACRDKGFFQLTNHGISLDMQNRIMGACKEFFSLPLEEKMKCHLSLSKHHRGYEGIGAQMLEPGSAPETKEGIYIGEHLPADHPRVLKGDFNCGPNLYPSALGTEWQETCMEYLRAATTLAQDVMRALALGLNLSETYFDDFTGIQPSAIVRLIHYPPTPRNSTKERGIGAHRDFGCITLLLQDQIGGLQVQDEATGDWLDVTPVPGALVVNLGNLMMRWTNHHYTSNTHRVMNFSDKDRYSIPFFFSGNASHTLSMIPGCEQRKDTSMKKFGPPPTAEEYGPILVRDFLNDQFVQSYKRAEQHKPSEPEAQSKDIASTPVISAAA